MKGKLIATVLVLSMLTLLVPTITLADTQTTTASVSFSDGNLIIENDPKDLGSNARNMDIDFGTHPVPVTDVVYTAVDSAHVLRISDARNNAGNWQVSVKLAPFIREETGENPKTKSFEGTITLKNGEAISVYGHNTPGTDFSIADPELVIDSRGSSVLVMQAGPTAKRDLFDAKWQKNNVTLSIDNDNAVLVELPAEGEANYAATMTWTLGIGI